MPPCRSYSEDMNCRERKDTFMELELKKTCLDAYEAGAELTLTQEETAETIVPDYCPDIARIIATEGKVYVHSRELREGKAEVSGTVRITVLYTPDGEGGIRILEFAIPFTTESDNHALNGCVYLTGDAEVEYLESRMLNPRKIFTHCKLIVRMAGYRKAPLCFCEDFKSEPQLYLEKRQEHQRAMLLTGITEKDFTFTDTMNLSPGREGAAELLNGRVCSSVTESKLVGNKLIVKGMFTVSVLYRTAGGKYCCHSAELPFSQIMEADGAAEGSLASIQLQLTGTDFQIDGEDAEGRQIAVTFYLHATALVRQEQELTLLSDLYSTAYHTDHEAAPLCVSGFWESFNRRQTIREVLEIGVVAESILLVSAACGGVSVSREGDHTVLRTAATVRALYLDEGGVPLVAERRMDVSCQLDLPQDCKVNAKAICPEEVQATIGDRGIEVRFPIDFRIEAATQTKKVCISSVTVNTDAPKDMSGAPSLVLRCLGKQESTWELAKANNTTIETILAANQLDSEADIPRETLLLIPRKRA